MADLGSATPTDPAKPAVLPDMADAAGYMIDAWQRTILFWDVQRERANDILSQYSAGAPDILAFRHETLLDARRFPRPANYALLRITAYGEDEADHCLDPAKPPLIVIDPRAGHGPGIGGTRRESELGIALHEGYPVYFVTFFPAPCPGQTLIDVLHALRRFVDAVAARHEGRPPILYGNCQGGWAAILLALHCEGSLGPVVLNGSPLSYWSGEPGVNPMRLAGGLSGGVWPVRLLADLGDGQFDGAWLVQNFEGLKPENALWEKYLPLFLDPEGERARFLAFERWWNTFYALSRDEITTIVRHLFIGNELERGVLDLGDGTRIDLRELRSPLVIFASQGDNITPPHQALGWIARVYRDTDALKQAGQRIVYLLNPKVGSPRDLRLGFGRPLRASRHPGGARRCLPACARPLRDDDRQPDRRSGMPATAIQRRVCRAPGRGPSLRASVRRLRARRRGLEVERCSLWRPCLAMDPGRGEPRGSRDGALDAPDARQPLSAFGTVRTLDGRRRGHGRCGARRKGTGRERQFPNPATCRARRARGGDTGPARDEGDARHVA